MANSFNPRGGNNPLSWETAVIAGSAVCGASTIHSQQKRINHARRERLHQQMVSLNRRHLTVKQFVAAQALEHVNPALLKDHLLSWGGTEDGISFANPDNFSIAVIEKGGLIKPPRYTLQVRGGPRELSGGNPGGGATEVSLLPANGPLSEEQGSRLSQLFQAANLREDEGSLRDEAGSVLRRFGGSPRVLEMTQGVEWKPYYAFTVPRTPFFETFLGSALIALPLTALSMAMWVWISERLKIRDKPNRASSIADTGAEPDAMRPHPLAPEGGHPTATASAASNAVLNVLTAFHTRKVAKSAALSLLREYHGKTEEEALALLEEPRLL
jgi:hypothetical protein